MIVTKTICFASVLAVLVLSATGVFAQTPAKSNSAAAASDASSSTSTKTTVAGRRVDKLVRVRLWKKDVRYAIDREIDSIGQLLDGATFDAKLPVKVTYPKLNPLKIQASASVAAVDDPRAAIVAKLIDAIAGIPAIVRPDTAGSAPGVSTKARQFAVDGSCPAYTEAMNTVQAIDSNVHTSWASPDSLSKGFGGWQTAIQDDLDKNQSGAQAVQSGVKSINTYLANLDTAITNAASAIADAEKHAAAPASPTPDRVKYNAFIDNIVAPFNGDQKKIAAAKAQFKTQIDTLSLNADKADDCASEANTLYALVRLTNPEAQLSQLRQLRKAIGDLATSLSDTYGAVAWENDTDYVLAVDITPTSSKNQEVTVKIVSIDADVSGGMFALKRSDSGSAVFTVERYMAFTPQIGLGAAFGFVTRPKYGTGKNAAGETIVTSAGEDQVSVDPTVMVNFVPTGMSGAVPFFQVGAATSKSTPAVFIGGGWKVPGASDDKGVAIGVGLMLAWVEELKTLTVNSSVVKGTSDIDADLAFNPQPKPRFYVNIQYKF